jgi:hypothetical protein
LPVIHWNGSVFEVKGQEVDIYEMSDDGNFSPLYNRVGMNCDLFDNSSLYLEICMIWRIPLH